MSDDAGDYICNYMFYRNLETCTQIVKDAELACTGLFVHFPAFRDCEEVTQEKFAKQLLVQLSTCQFNQNVTELIAETGEDEPHRVEEMENDVKKP